MSGGPRTSQGGLTIHGSIAPPEEREQTAVENEALAKQIPRYHVVLLDDADHTYDYVVEMLMALFQRIH